MRSNIRLRFRLYASVLPLVAVVVLLSGVLATLESREAITRLASRHMTFKAEQLRDYFYNEWTVMQQLGLEKEDVYRGALEASLRSYSLSLLRSRTELILAFNAEGKQVMRVGLDALPPSADETPGSSPGIQLTPGWFTEHLLGRDRVGVAFELKPLGWTVAVTEVQSTFFSEVRNIQTTNIWILIISVIVVAIFLSIFIAHVTGPVERLTATIGRVAATGDLSQRAEIEFVDEIGTLGASFNSMISSLQASHEQLEATSEAEVRARQLAVAREEETLYLLGRVTDYRDSETGAHLRRIGDLSALMARLIGQTDDEQYLIRNSSPLHDIGKLGIPDAVLLKAGKLDIKEFEIMKHHTWIGYDLLKDARSVYLVEGARIALSHHEKWDGSGYPAGTKGEEIPLSGRIVGIVDVFDALISTRPYKEAWSFERTREYIAGQRGRHFDPHLVDVFLENFAAFEQCVTQERY